jgi:hypothetical protein
MSEEHQCGHTKLFMDSFRGPEKLEPCIFCEREQLRGALRLIRDHQIPQGMSPALFAEKVLQ